MTMVKPGIWALNLGAFKCPRMPQHLMHKPGQCRARSLLSVVTHCCPSSRTLVTYAELAKMEKEVTGDTGTSGPRIRIFLSNSSHSKLSKEMLACLLTFLKTS